MMGLEIGALLSFFGLTSAFAVVGALLGAWMAWRIVEKAGFSGWFGLGAVLLTLTGVASIVPLVLLWVFAFVRWPRDDVNRIVASLAPPAAGRPGAAPVAAPAVLAPPSSALADRRGWQLSGSLPAGGTVSLALQGDRATWLLTGSPRPQAGELSLPDLSVGQPHARLMSAGGRLGLEDLGAGETLIDGARLLPEHGPRDISAARSIRVGAVTLALTRA